MSKGVSGREGGCNDQILAVRQVVEKTIKKDRSVYMAFVDLEKA